MLISITKLLQQYELKNEEVFVKNRRSFCKKLKKFLLKNE